MHTDTAAWIQSRIRFRSIGCIARILFQVGSGNGRTIRISFFIDYQYQRNSPNV